MLNAARCLESHAFGQEAGFKLNDGSTEIVARVIQLTSANRLQRLDLCQLNPGLLDLLDVSGDLRVVQMTPQQRKEVVLLEKSPLGRLTGVFDGIVEDRSDECA